MSVLSRITVTPLLYVIAALLIALVVMGVNLKMAKSDVRTAEAEQGKAEAQRDTAQTEREAWKRRTQELTAANTLAATEIRGLVAALKASQGENRRIASEGQRAIAAAQAEARDADLTLQAFTAKFQTESRKPTCARALEALGAACPALEDY